MSHEIPDFRSTTDVLRRLIETLQIDVVDNEFIMDNNLAYVKPAVIRDKQHHVCSENTLYAPNSFSAGAPLRTPLGELMTLPKPPSWLGREYPLPIPHTLDAYGVSISAPLARVPNFIF